MEKTINKLFAFGCWLLALLKIKAKGERLIANSLTSYNMLFCFLTFDILSTKQRRLNQMRYSFKKKQRNKW